MITITRRQVRHLRGVFRRSVLGVAHRGLIPPLVLRVEGSQLRAQHRYHSLAIEHVLPGTYARQGAIAVPFDALVDFEGRDDTPVEFSAVADDRTVVRWRDRGVPQTREYAVTPIDALAPFPEPPVSWTAGPAKTLAALVEANATSAENSARYALNCLQLRGDPGEIAATDGRQMLIQSGFPFPWQDSLLIRRSPVFASHELPDDQPVSIARIDTHVVLRVGPWTLFLEIQAEGRFPVLGDIIPDPRYVASRLQLDHEDATFLTEALGALPGSRDLHAPTTLDLNGVVAVRARSSDPVSTTEVILPRSRYTGTPVRISTSRALLGRAMRLGFTAVEIIDADQPVVCRDRARVYCWQPLNKESAIEPTDDVTRIEPPSTSTQPSPRSDINCEGDASVSQTINPATQPVETGGISHVAPATTESAGPGGLTALIQEAEDLHETISDIKSRSGRLIVALKKYRRRERLVASTLASLKELRLPEVSDAAR